MELIEVINTKIENLQTNSDAYAELLKGNELFDNSQCISLYHSKDNFEFIINDKYEDRVVSLNLDGEDVVPVIDKQQNEWNRYSFASLLQLKSDLEVLNGVEKLTHKQYTREGMIDRVLRERKDKALKAYSKNDYTIEWADNIYGDHILTNEKGKKYKIFLRDFDKETGYSDSEDSKYNKLGTTKHIMYAFHKLKEDRNLYNRLDKRFPFVEIYLDPLNEYRISWNYPEKLPEEARKLIRQYFGLKKYIPNDQVATFVGFTEQAVEIKQIKIRPEVYEKIERECNMHLLHTLAKSQSPDLSFLNIKPFPYQEEGITFATFRKACIIADEMGLGKTLQAIAAAVAKKQIFDFQKTLIVCPASLKEQWQSEIKKFTGLSAHILDGTPEERTKQYKSKDHFFYIVNYEAVRRDYKSIANSEFDFLILDEAQRVKNFETKTFFAIKKIVPKHVLAITGTPIENRLIDIYSIMQILDPAYLGPLWEFSYKHCLFDIDRPNKINGYYNLKALKRKLEDIVIRREKRRLLDQLPGIQQKDVPVVLTMDQASYHASYASALSKILNKKFLTPADMQRIQMNLLMMRMVCNSTYLVDGETNVSPKLVELERILIDKLDVKNSDRKIIIFSEWVKCHKLIGQVLRRLNIGFAELNGGVPVKKRGALIRKFENDKNCKVFLSTEAGGAGLNLQVADTLINFELPWNPAKKNQRIGRIDRLGQKNANLTIINLITLRSIEAKIAAGLVVKQNLFEGVLDEHSDHDIVDFSEKGRSQFLKEIEEMANEFDRSDLDDIEEPLADEQEEVQDDNIQMDLFEEKQGDSKPASVASQENDEKTSNSESSVQSKQMEDVMNNGLDFLSGLFKMATGKDVGLEGKKMEIDEKTGEVTIKFKLPV